MAFKNGDKVVWNEGYGRTAYGTVICEEIRAHAEALGVHPNPFGHYTINVGFEDLANYHKACRTAYEMNSGWVSRSVELHKLRAYDASVDMQMA